MLSRSRVIRVSFPEPVQGRCDWFFGSLKAIFERFSERELGLTLDDLYHCIFPVRNRWCTIEYVEVSRIARRKKGPSRPS